MWWFWYRMPVRRRRFACDPQKLTEVEWLDKYEFQIKTEQMEKLLKKTEYKAAAKIADSID